MMALDMAVVGLLRSPRTEDVPRRAFCHGPGRAVKGKNRVPMAAVWPDAAMSWKGMAYGQQGRLLCQLVGVLSLGDHTANC